MLISLVFCLVIGAIGCQGSVLPAYELGSLYSSYNGEYAGKYDNYEPRSYAYEYGVSDPHTGDHKTQWETKDKAGVVRGSYSLLEADGSTRVVDYVADDHGFRAVVKKIGVHGHPESIESHGGAEIEAPQVAHLAPEPIIATPVAYNSYDGGYEDYTGLQPVVQDVYTKPLDYIHAPKAERLLVNVPEHEVPTTYSQKIALPQEYFQQYLPQEKYVLPQKYYAAPQYTIPEHNHVAPEYLVPEYKQYQAPLPAPLPEYKLLKEYQVPQYEHEVSKEYPLPQAPVDKVAYSYVQEQRYKTPKAPAVLVESPKAYAVAPEFYSHVEAPKSYVAGPEVYSHVAAPKSYVAGPEVYSHVAAPTSYVAGPTVLPSPHAQYNLNVDYHY